MTDPLDPKTCLSLRGSTKPPSTHPPRPLPPQMHEHPRGWGGGLSRGPAVAPPLTPNRTELPPTSHLGDQNSPLPSHPGDRGTYRA